MLGNMILAVLVMVLMLMMCWLVMEHVLDSDEQHLAEDTDIRSIWDKALYAYERFWQKIFHTGEFRRNKFKKEFGSWKN